MGLGAAAAGGLASLGIGAETAAIAGPILADAAIGTVGAAATGGNIGEGALFGGIGGGIGEALGGAGGLGGLFGGGTDAGAGTAAGAGAGTVGAAPAATASLAAPVGAIPAAGGIGAGGDISSIVGATGAAPAGGVGGIGAGSSLITPSTIGTTSDFGTLGGAGGGAAGSTALSAPGSFGGAGSITGASDSIGVGSGATLNTGGAGALNPTTISPLTNQPLTPQSLNSPNIGSTFEQSTLPETFGGRALDFAGRNPGLLLGGAGLGASLLMNQTPPGLGSLESQAALESGQGNRFAGSLASGQLPQGAQASLDQATQAAKATMRSKFGSLGLTGSSQESEALAGIDQQAASQKYEMLLQLTQTGLSEVNAADSLYGTIMNAEIAQNSAAQQAIGRFAGAIAGGTGGGGG